MKKLFHKLFGTSGVSFNSYSSCDKRSGDSILYLYPLYKDFLASDNGLSKFKRIQALLYCENRQHLLSKHMAVEIVRQKMNDPLGKRKK